MPAAPDAWITALKHFGTKSFGEVAEASIRYARDGFSMHPTYQGTIESAQAIANHESPRTTKLYDRTSDELTLDEVERIRI